MPKMVPKPVYDSTPLEVLEKMMHDHVVAEAAKLQAAKK